MKLLRKKLPIVQEYYHEHRSFKKRSGLLRNHHWRRIFGVQPLDKLVRVPDTNYSWQELRTMKITWAMRRLSPSYYKPYKPY